jgi:hypothetical protein
VVAAAVARHLNAAVIRLAYAEPAVRDHSNRRVSPAVHGGNVAPHRQVNALACDRAGGGDARGDEEEPRPRATANAMPLDL